MKTLLFSCFVLLQFSIFAQDWATYFSDDKLTIDVAKVIYKDKTHGLEHERIVFRYVNKTPQEIHFSFSRIHSYDGIELQSSPEREFEITLLPNETRGYSKSVEKNKLYYIFKKDNNDFIKRKLSSFDVLTIIYL
ncbi:MAG: hypothetical protein COA33_011690 [Fluviicola sp.]|nr:hypothetical protein [Fluviicola sp.]